MSKVIKHTKTASRNKALISIIIPCYNESLNIQSFYEILKKVTRDNLHRFEFLYVNDGSLDDTLDQLKKLARKDSSIKVLNLSRNFGKEIAITAGIHQAKGDAIILIDADGQHPAELIPQFIQKWEAGSQVVIGVRESNQKEGIVKKYGSKLFYNLFNSSSGATLVPGSTDYRLIDRDVRGEFVRLTERNRITRGLIDWLGFKKDYIYFKANPRMAGEASYNVSKLMVLALNSFISLSLKPLYFSIYAGAIILPLSIVLAISSAAEMAIGDPLGLRITGSAYLAILILFLIGLLLISQGITALYLSHIHIETKNRPLFIIDKSTSHNLEIEQL